MDSNWASEHLQVIRTLMERAAVYRRALAPIMLSVGVLGTATGVLGLFTHHFETNRSFAGLWMACAIVAVIVAYVLARRQALREDEPFWSPPTRRVTEALVPGFLAGGLAGLLLVMAGDKLPAVQWLLGPAWVVLYGCALHASGFFMVRGIKVFGLAITTGATLCLLAFSLSPPLQAARSAHLVMGVFFGVLHLAYGIYLQVTERRARL